MSRSPLVRLNIDDESIDEVQNRLCLAITEKARKLDLIYETYNVKVSVKQPRINKDCKELKKVVNRNLRIYRKSYFNELNRKKHRETLRQSKTLLDSKRNNHFEQLMKKANNVENSQEFWKTIGKYRVKKYVLPEISGKQSANFFKNLSKPVEKDSNLYMGVLDPVLDTDFNIYELNNILKSTKKGKSPGEDKIVNEFYRECPKNWKYYFLYLFDKILREKMVPENWASIIQTMIYKKGEKTDPANYRGISPVNHITKIFTSQVAVRLHRLAEN